MTMKMIMKIYYIIIIIIKPNIYDQSIWKWRKVVLLKAWYVALLMKRDDDNDCYYYWQWKETSNEEETDIDENDDY